MTQIELIFADLYKNEDSSGSQWVDFFNPSIWRNGKTNIDDKTNVDEKSSVVYRPSSIVYIRLSSSEPTMPEVLCPPGVQLSQNDGALQKKSAFIRIIRVIRVELKAT